MPNEIEKLQHLIREILAELGENPDREGLKRTPLRVARVLETFTSGHDHDVDEVLNGAIFTEQCDEMVVVRDIEVYSLCEHHMLPFFGKVHVAYIPDGRIVGLSKLARIVDVFARRLQVQERLTSQIANCLREALEPIGVAVIIEALHLCMAMRGVERQNSVCVTSTMLGAFRSDRSTRMEFMELIGRK